MKALGTGHSQGVLWRDVEVVRRGGPPQLRLHGGAAPPIRGDGRPFVAVDHHTHRRPGDGAGPDPRRLTQRQLAFLRGSARASVRGRRAGSRSTPAFAARLRRSLCGRATARHAAFDRPVRSHDDQNYAERQGKPAGKTRGSRAAFQRGPLEGLKLIGFSIWERRGGNGRNVTFPARSYVVNGERRSFALLRPIVDSTAQSKLRDLILEAFQEYEERAAIAS